ncbi:MAG: hypothetical protein A2252_09050 [Elusimicrobia bacterium RIFOXYA2_FULL_39_19]|nr:MAG: hypothetical protein A2252_09050 [Elusimicrobia bacterium RIFOXYA2_FULL_39_19]
MKTILLNIILLFSLTQIHCSDLIWTQKANMPTAREGAGVGVVDNKIYVIGGTDRSGTFYSTVEEYDPFQNTWTTKASMPTARKGFCVGVVSNKIYAIGGYVYNGTPTELSVVEEYDPVQDSWTTRTSMPTARSFAVAGVVNNKIYVIGGGYSSSSVFFSTVEEYNPEMNTWTTKTSMPTARYGASSGVVNNKIYVISGEIYNQLSSKSSSIIEEYDPMIDTWTVKTNVLLSRRYSSAGVLNNKIYIIGGDNLSMIYYDKVEEYDPIENTCIFTTLIDVQRAALSVGVVNNKLYAIGGFNPSVTSAIEEGVLYSLPDHYEVVTPTYTISSGSNFSMTVTAKNDAGDTLTGYSGNVSLQTVLASNEAVAGSGVLGITNATLTNGAATINTQTYNRGEAIKIKAIDSNYKAGLSSAIDFVPTYALAISLSANPSSVLTGEAAQITAEIKDYYGSPLKNAVVSFSVVSGSGSLSASTGITDATGKVTVNVTPLLSGICEVRAVSNGLSAVTVNVNTLTLVLSANGGIVVSDDSRSKIEIAPNILTGNAVIAISKVTGVNTGQGQEFEITGEEETTRQKITDLNGAVKLVLYYELDANSKVANTDINGTEVNDKLALFYWDGVNWQKMGGAVDTLNQTVSASVTHFSKYALKASIKPSGFNYQRVSPRPFTPNPDGLYDRAYFYFDNPENSAVEIKVFDLKGALVRNIDANTGSTPYWDGRDNNGKMMQGGVYIFQMKVGSNIVKDTIILAK